MSQAKFTASERADKCVLSLEQAIYQTAKRERGLVGEMFDDIAELMKRFADMNNTTLAAIAQIQKVILTAEAMEAKP